MATDLDAAGSVDQDGERGGQAITGGGAQREAVRFARVRVKESPPRIATRYARYAPMLVRISFSNGRCAELQLLDVGQLAEVLAVLERAP